VTFNPKVARHVAFSTSIGYILYSSTVLALLILGSLLNRYYSYQHSFTAYAAYAKATVAGGGPTFCDPNLKVELVVKGLSSLQVWHS
jgi:hypothetical protein